jgi:hypothetical protein
MDEKKSLTLRIGSQALSVITKISKATNQSPEKVLMLAIGFYAWALEESSNGAKIASIISTEDGEDIAHFVDLGIVNKEEMEKPLNPNNKVYN